MRHKVVFAGSGVLLALLAAAVMPAAARTGASSTVACGDVITSDVALVRNLTCAGDGLTVTNGALLDLHGQRIRGDGSGRGVTVLGSGTVLTNGTVTGFDTGVYVDSNGGRVEDLVVRNNQSYGIYLDGFHGGSDIVQRNRVEGNGTGIRLALAIRLTQILDNDVVENQGDGIIAPDQNDGSHFERNNSSRNGGNGLVVSESVATILDNRLNRNALDGLRADDLPEFVSFWLIGGNRANFNGGHGLNAITPGMGDGGGNRAVGNALEPQCVNLLC
jgi:Periplasmic copper-binding protein (NosD)